MRQKTGIIFRIFPTEGSLIPSLSILVILKNPCTVNILLLQPIKGLVRNYRFKNKILPLILTGASAIIAFIVYSLSPNNDTAVSLIFVSLIPIFAICGFDGRIPIGAAILLLILAAGIPRFGLPLALFSFWLLVVGVSCLLIGLLRNKLKET